MYSYFKLWILIIYFFNSWFFKEAYTYLLNSQRSTSHTIQLVNIVSQISELVSNSFLEMRAGFDN